VSAKKADSQARLTMTTIEALAGRFSDGTGLFFGDDTLQGKPIRAFVLSGRT
jgi:hypothetical protein